MRVALPSAVIRFLVEIRQSLIGWPKIPGCWRKDLRATDMKADAQTLPASRSRRLCFMYLFVYYFLQSQIHLWYAAPPGTPSQSMHCHSFPNLHYQQLRKNNSYCVLTRQNKANDEKHLHQLGNTSAANTTQLNRKTQMWTSSNKRTCFWGTLKSDGHARYACFAIIWDLHSYWSRLLISVAKIAKMWIILNI